MTSHPFLNRTTIDTGGYMSYTRCAKYGVNATTWSEDLVTQVVARSLSDAILMMFQTEEYGICVHACAMIRTDNIDPQQ